LVEAGVVFKALGVSLDDTINAVRTTDSKFINILTEQYNSAATKDDAIRKICKELPESQDEKFVKTILETELFYHTGILTPEKASLHLGYILKQLFSVVNGCRKCDDKENLSNKRLDSTGELIAYLFRGLFKLFVKTVMGQIKARSNPDPLTIIKSINVITYGISSCFLTGNWTHQKSADYMRVGVSQVLSVQNYGARQSYLRRIMLPNGTKGKVQKARYLHASHFSFICPYETPEGDTVGLVTNLAVTTSVSVRIPSCEIEPIIRLLPGYSSNASNVQLILNGNIIGFVDDEVKFRKEFNECRKMGFVEKYVSYVFLYHINEVHISSDAGRLVRPLFLVFGLPQIIEKEGTFNELVEKGYIVFRDVWELEQAVVGIDENDLFKNKCDYVEICPAGTMMGIMASVIPFANHSQSPRNAYQASMGKQAIGIASQAYQYRYDTTLHVMDYPQKPITQSKMVNVLHFDEMSHGQMPIVAIMTCSGFNQEDSIILNKGSLDRGLFSVMTYKTIVEEGKKRGNSEYETIGFPNVEYRKSDINYSYLQPNGIIRRDKTILLKVSDAIIGKTFNKMTKQEDGTRSFKTIDSTVVIKSGEEGYLDDVIDAMNNEGLRIIKIRIRLHRYPEIGDKFASSTAQKGTCGMIFRQEDMPFDQNGLTPDLIINPHAIPSRMTINMLIEMCLNIYGCKVGKIQDATTFAHHNIEDELSEKLSELGLDSYSTTLYSGTTGIKYPSKIFMGPSFYQRLKHMVSDKIHARMSGPLDPLTHQPVPGRSRDGGLRFGEMERDAVLVHGSTSMLREYMFLQSDKYIIPVCKICGTIPHTQTYCQICKSEDVEMKYTPYATKLAYQELMGMGIKIKIT
jgi:DNA-directed RNA polymerase beta subunit